ncbi:hypothetical protein L2E82_22916 [Cichorium intybus]|uniref:Uncharacterized protein n=1 Tax=Cichorium intybus TaxID=13427 RepID=A0ACB9DZI7_CICIN|nr:hypothetical protein L2E82_22916 [Cichorium intybus]
MYSENLVGSVKPYERHVFLCYKTHEDWPARVESSDTDLLPKRLAGAIKERKNDIAVKVRFEFEDADESIEEAITCGSPSIATVGQRCCERPENGWWARSGFSKWGNTRCRDLCLVHILSLKVHVLLSSFCYDLYVLRFYNRLDEEKRVK